MLGLVVLLVVIALYLLGWVGLLSVLGAVVLSAGSFGALVYDRPRDKWKRAGFVILTVVGIAMIAYDVLLA